MRSISRPVSIALVIGLLVVLLAAGTFPALAGQAATVRGLVRQAAKADRPGEVSKVKAPDFFKDPAMIPCNTTHKAAVTVVYTAAPTPGVWFACRMKSGIWKVYEGPLYGE